MKHRICAEAQGDGVPCMSVRVACDECVRARPIRKRVRRRKAASAASSGGSGEAAGAAPPEARRDDSH
jgi:hypothetical protein